MSVGVVIVVVMLGLLVAFVPVGFLLATRTRDDRTDVAVEGDEIVLRPKGFDRFTAFRRELRIPTAAIKDIHTGPAGKPGGLRLGGTYIPGLAIAGTYVRKSRTREFFNVRWNRQALILDVDPSKANGFGKVVVGVADLEATTLRLKSQALKFPQ